MIRPSLYKIEPGGTKSNDLAIEQYGQMHYGDLESDLFHNWTIQRGWL